MIIAVVHGEWHWGYTSTLTQTDTNKLTEHSEFMCVVGASREVGVGEGRSAVYLHPHGIDSRWPKETPLHTMIIFSHCILRVLGRRFQGLARRCPRDMNASHRVSETETLFTPARRCRCGDL